MQITRYGYIVVTTLCNNRCFHCSNNELMTKYKGYVKLDMDAVKAVDISNYDSILIMGGEPGLLSLEEKQQLIDYLPREWGRKVTLLTNGTNLKDWPIEYHVVYHIVDFSDKPFIRNNTVYDIVITDNSNIELILDFIKSNKEIEFRLRKDTYISSCNNYDKLISILEKECISHHFDYFDTRENPRMEKFKNCTCVSLKNKYNKINLFKKCSCEWYICCKPS